MKYLSGAEFYQAERWMIEAREVAKLSTCLRSKCGSIIVAEQKIIIGKGYNSPPGNLESQRRCLKDKKEYHEKIGDKSCCIHAEQRAINYALQVSPKYLEGSDLYFIRLNQSNDIVKSGKPYCTHCSKLALDMKIANFILWHEDGICSYGTEEYNDLSFEYEE